MSSLEKLKLLSITGGVPKYLEEIVTSKTAEKNILDLCFSAEGFLVHEYDKIFNEIFSKRNSTYNEIVRALCASKLTMSELAKKLNMKPNGDFSECLYNLEISGFLKKERVYTLNGRSTGVSKYRLNDNYLRFYFKYIEPNKSKILSRHFAFESVYQFSNWESLVGLQFENLILHNLEKLYDLIDIAPGQILSAGPYSQRKSARTKGATQIDILITTAHKSIYVCELKVRESLNASLIKEMEKKIQLLRIPRGYSVRPILIYEGAITEKSYYELKNYFHQLIHFEEFFK